MLDMQVQSLGWKDALEKDIATHASILAWEIPWTEEPGGLECIQLQRIWHDWVPEHKKEGIDHFLILAIIFFSLNFSKNLVHCVMQTNST